MSPITQQIADLINTIERKKLTLEELLVSLRKTTETFTSSLESPSDLDSKTAPGKKPATRSHFKQIADFLASQNNANKTMREIADATGLWPCSISAVLYYSHKGCFEKKEKQNGQSRVLWRLTPEVLQKFQ